MLMKSLNVTANSCTISIDWKLKNVSNAYSHSLPRPPAACSLIPSKTRANEQDKVGQSFLRFWFFDTEVKTTLHTWATGIAEQNLSS